MLGFILVTHSGVGQPMIKAVEDILKEKVSIPCVEVDANQDIRLFHDKIRESLETLKDRSGVLILTDLFGATPSNICREFCRPGKIEMVSGCNLPMLLKAATAQFPDNLDEVAQFLKKYGNENIRICQGEP